MKPLEAQIEALTQEDYEDHFKLKSKLKLLCKEYDDKFTLSQNLLELSHTQMLEWSFLIEQRESLIKSILNSSTDMIITFDNHLQILEFNTIAERIFSDKKKMARGENLFNFISSPEFKQDIQNELDLIGSGVFKKRIVLSRTVTLPSGKSFPSIINFTHISTSRRSDFTLYIRDLTEEIRAKNELDFSRSAAAQSTKMASLGEMAGSIAHEINTPLAVILMNSEILNDAISEDVIDKLTLSQAAQTIQSTTDRIAKIITGMRKFTRDDSKDSMDEEVFIQQIIEDAVVLCKNRYKTSSAELNVSIIPSEWKIKGRSTGLTQVLLNLLNNSLDAIGDLKEKWASIEVWEQKDSFQIIVTDSGPGIPEEIRENLMQPFYSTKPLGKGTGIGLSISKGIIESHDGKLELDTTCSNTRFIITLPKSIEAI